MAKIIAIEGLDAVGKTSLRNYLSDKYNFITIKPPFPSNSIQRDQQYTLKMYTNIIYPYYKSLYGIISNLENNICILFDRFLPSVYAYEYANSNTTKKEFQSFYEIMDLYLRLNLNLIYIDNTITPQYLNRLSRKETIVFPFEYYKSIQDGYKQILDIIDKKDNIKIFKINSDSIFTKDSIFNNLIKIISYVYNG